MEKTKCLNCGAGMRAKAENYRYDASGLDGIVLLGITVWRCPECGNSEAEIPRIEELHNLIAHELVNKPGRLAPKEVRFLRKRLGWSGVEFARHMGAEPEVVSRWENKGGMGGQADRLLRVLVQIVKPTHDYSVDSLTEIDEEKKTGMSMRLRPGKKTWAAEDAAA